MTNRFELEDKPFFEFRDTLENRNFSLSDIDHFTLFAGIHNFARKKFLVDQLELTLDVSGSIYEFGTWRGSTLVLLAAWYKMRRPQGHKRVFAFDGFEGLAAGTEDDGNAHGEHIGEYKGDAALLDELIRLRGLDTHITLVAGDILETASRHFEAIPFSLVSFALIDVDLFEPAKAAIDCVLPNLTPGGKIIFDEGTAPEWEGEQRAVNYLKHRAEQSGIPYSLTENPITRQSTTVFTRLPATGV